MRKRTFLFTAIALFVMIVGIGCEKNTEKIADEKIILPINNPSENIVSFFNKELPEVAEAECFFNTSDENVSYVINSDSEFKDIFSCEKELPDIDFKKYSLVIGQHTMPISFCKVVEQSIIESDVLELNLTAEPLSQDGYWNAFSKMYYWGLYPKLSNKQLIVNVISNIE